MSKNKKLWDKGTSTDKIVENYLAGDDVLIDQELVNDDVYGSIAHCQMWVNGKFVLVF